MPTNPVGPDRLAAFALFALVFVTHSLSPNATSADSHWIVAQMVSVLSEGNTDLNEYPELLREHNYRDLDCVDPQYRVASPNPANGCSPGSRYYGHFPLGTAVAALPPMLAMDAVLRVAGPLALSAAGGRFTPTVRTFLKRDYVHCNALVEMVLASFLMGVAAVFVFLTGREFLSRRMAVFLALLFAYATAAWSTGSRALWQHGPEMTLFAIALYLLMKAGERPSLGPWSALPLAFAYFVRPTGAIVLATLGVFVFIHRREWFRRWILLAAATAVPFLAYNMVLYRRPMQPYFTNQAFLEPAARNAGRFLVALAGQLLSPSRGLFVFSPFLLFALWGIRMAFRGRWQTPLTYYLAVILLLHWIAISAFADWTAGSCFGPRYFSDVAPIFIFFLVPVLAAYETRPVPRLAVAAFAIAVLIGFTIHLRGAVNWDVENWNSQPVNAARAWDWKDPQFLRGILR
jgi:hypothetical protein